MRPAPFEHHEPTTAREAVELLATLDDVKLLAGGQSLVPILAMRLGAFAHLVDLSRLGELRGVEVADGNVRIGSMTTQSAFELDPAAAAAAPLFARATEHIGHFQIRNRGTVGGSLAHADPAAEYPAVALALDAWCCIDGVQTSRRVPADEFFVGTWTTALADTELLVAVEFASWGPNSGFGVAEVARRHGDFALAGAVSALELDDGDHIRRAAIALFGVAETPVRARASEALLIGTRAGSGFLDAAAAARTGLAPPADVHASATYRLEVVPVVVRRALERALADCAGGSRA